MLLFGPEVDEFVSRKEGNILLESFMDNGFCRTWLSEGEVVSIGSSLPTSVGLLLGLDFRDLDRRGVCERRVATSSLDVVANRELTKTPKDVEVVLAGGGGGSGLWLVGEASACSEWSGFDWLACQIERRGDAIVLSNNDYV